MSTGGSKAPKTPSASEQAQGNIATAQAQAHLDNPTQVTPLGTSAWSVAPNNLDWTQNISLSPEMQWQLHNLQGIAAGLMPNISTNPTNVPGFNPANFNFDQATQNAQNAAYQNATQYLNPQFQQQSLQLSQSLADRGIPIGSEAYNLAMDEFGRTKQQAYEGARNQAYLQGLAAQQQGFSQGMQGRQQLISEKQIPLSMLSNITALEQGGMPQFQGSQQPTVQGIDWNAIMAGNAAKAQAANQQQAGVNQLIGTGAGLAGLGAMLLL